VRRKAEMCVCIGGHGIELRLESQIRGRSCERQTRESYAWMGATRWPKPQPQPLSCPLDKARLAEGHEQKASPWTGSTLQTMACLLFGLAILKPSVIVNELGLTSSCLGSMQLHGSLVDLR